MSTHYAIYIFGFFCCLIFQVQSRNYPLSTSIRKREGGDDQAAALNNSLENQRTDVSIKFDADYPWENYIISGPPVVSLLGQLMVMSTKVDFSLIGNWTIDKFKHVRYPNSFRATLVQVSNDGWEAFMNAHKNMDKIQLFMQMIPARVKTALKVILTAPPKLINRLLPIELSSIESIGRQCVSLSAETENKFSDVMSLLGEILESTEATHKTYDDKLFLVKAELNASTVQKQHLDKIGEDLRQRQKQVDDQVKKYQNAYEEALDEIPTGWEAIAQNFVRAAVNLVNVGQIFGIGGGGDGGDGGAGLMGNKPVDGPDFETSNGLAIAQQVFDQVAEIKTGITKVFNGEIKDNQNPAGMFSAFNTVFSSFENMLSSSNAPVAQKAVPLIQQGRRICGRMQDMLKDITKVGNITDDKKSDIYKDVDDLIENVKPLAAEGASASDGVPMPERDPGTFSGTDGNARFKAYMNLELLKDAQRRSDKVFENTLKYQEELKNLMTRMATLDMERINFQDIIQLIKEGILILAKIRTEWNNLVLFFHHVSGRVVALNETLIPFVQHLEQAKEMGEDMVNENREFFRGILQQQAVEISNVAFYLFTVSSTYVEVSDKFLMGRLAGLAQMLAASDEQQRKLLLSQLQTESDGAQVEIKRLVQEKRLAAKNQAQQRIDDVNDYVQKLGGPSDGDKIAAKNGIDAAKKKATN